jgi:hypothetical protein
MVNFSLFIFFIAISTFVFGNVEEGLKQVSIHDRTCMRAFFDHSVKMDQIAHILFFENKPVSLIAIVLKAKGHYFNDIFCLKGWRAFKKNEYLFPHPHFIFSESAVDFNRDFKVLHIYLINKKSLENCLNTHLSIFKEILGQEIDSKLFIRALEEGQSLDSLIHKNEALLGILLGFGAESSNAFLNFNAGYPQQGTYNEINIKSPKGCKIQPVVFMGNPNSREVKELVSLYEKELEEFSKLYKQKKDRLKLVLEKLCAEQ